MKTIVLNATTKSIKARLSAAPATVNPDFIASWADNNGTIFTEGSTDGALNGSTDVVIVAAPAASTRRTIKDISISNKDTTSVIVSIIFDNNGTQRLITKVTLSPGDTWTLEGTYNSSGSFKGIGSDGAQGIPGETLWESDEATTIKPIDAKTVDASHLSGVIYGGLFQP